MQQQGHNVGPATTSATIRCGTFEGQRGIVGRRTDTAAYVDLPGIGSVLCRLADLDMSDPDAGATPGA
jgi:hypothetical protein